ncbi:AzlD family protein [Lacibacterium aquatile]|uniref:AzlD family protein n=1 Tax=Lacibacterium aquatile TaxID=1168082 RepID=A0ABW5DTF6_9PROT
MREWYAVDPAIALAILAMGVAAALPRMGGLALVRIMGQSPLMEAWLRHVPAAMFAAICAPALIKGSIAEWLAAATTLLVARLGGNLAVTLICAIGTVAGLRAIL